MSSEDIVFEDEKPALAPEAKKITQFFETPIAEAVKAHGPEDVDDLAETPLAYTAICEPMLKELYMISRKMKELAKADKRLKAELKKLLGLERGMIQRGQFGVKVTEKKGSTKTDYVGALVMIKAYVDAQIGAVGKAEVSKLVQQNTSTGDPTTSIQAYVVGQEPEDDN
jgi:hypothetical protein